MVIDCNSILSRVPPPGAVPVSLHEAAQMWNASGLSGSIRDVSLVGMVVKIQAPRPVKGDLKVNNNTKNNNNNNYNRANGTRRCGSKTRRFLIPGMEIRVLVGASN